MNSADVIVVGAGAAGLMIARELSKAGKSVIVLEARDRIGGRIHTIKGISSTPIETGAEFIHGDLPVTFEILKEAGIGHRITGGESFSSFNGEFTQDENIIAEGDLLGEKLAGLKEDMTVAAFLETHFNKDEHAELKETVRGFVEGYDAGDITRASTFILKKEWQGISDEDQHRVNGGYVAMLDFFGNELRKFHCRLVVSTIVKKINWREGEVEVTTANQERYTAGRIVVTVPLGVLCAPETAEASIQFSPSLAGKEKLFHLLGYGGVIKILLLFKEPFWEAIKTNNGRSLKNMGWIFSDETIPTWWSQAPDRSSLLTGWLAGPKALPFKDADDTEVLDAAIASLSKIFKLKAPEISALLIHSGIQNWLADPFSLGAYSFATPDTSNTVKQLVVPLNNTIFFAGEALYDGPEIGTVEAALANGKAVAAMVLG